MAQTLRPDSVSSTDGVWVASTVGEWQDTSDSDDGTGVFSSSAAVLTMTLSNPSGTPGGTDGTAHLRMNKGGGSGTMTARLEIFEGANLRGSLDQVVSVTITTYDFAVTGVTDWNNLTAVLTNLATGIRIITVQEISVDAPDATVSHLLGCLGCGG